MKWSRSIVPLAFILAGCGVGSVSQTFQDANRVYDSKLIGSWKTEDDELIDIASDNAGGYLIALQDENGEPGRFIGRLARLGRFYVMDVQPDKSLLATNDSYRDLMLPLHSVLFFDSVASVMHVRGIQPDSLYAYLSAHPDATPHVQLEDILLFTGGSSEVEAFLSAFVQRPGVLDQVMVMSRVLAQQGSGPTAVDSTGGKP